MIGKAIWLTIMLLVIMTFIFRAMQGLPISTVFYETSEIVTLI